MWHQHLRKLRPHHEIRLPSQIRLLDLEDEVDGCIVGISSHITCGLRRLSRVNYSNVHLYCI